MQPTPGTRLKEWREYKGLTLKQMFERTGIRVTTLSTAEQPSSGSPSYDTIYKVLSAFPDLNPDWLLLGNGPMLRDGRALAPLPAPAVVQEPAAPGLQVAYRADAEKTELLLENARLRAKLEAITAEAERYWQALSAQAGLGKLEGSEFAAAPMGPPVGFRTQASKGDGIDILEGAHFMQVDDTLYVCGISERPMRAVEMRALLTTPAEAKKVG